MVVVNVSGHVCGIEALLVLSSHHLGKQGMVF